MADLLVRISDLPGGDPLAGIELIPMLQNGTTVVRTAADIVSEGGLQAHIDAVDPHPQYTTTQEASDAAPVQSVDGRTGDVTLGDLYEPNRLDNLTATTDPTVNDDDTQGYEVLSRWVNTVTGEIFLCVSASTGAADWQQNTLTLDELGSAALANVGAGNGLDADLLDGQEGAFYLDFPNFTNLPDPVITLDGDVTGSATMTDLGDVTITVAVQDDSHNHTIANVDNLQTELDSLAADIIAFSIALG